LAGNLGQTLSTQFARTDVQGNIVPQAKGKRQVEEVGELEN